MRLSYVDWRFQLANGCLYRQYWLSRLLKSSEDVRATALSPLSSYIISRPILQIEMPQSAGFCMKGSTNIRESTTADQPPGQHAGGSSCLY
jgi:hypothetical protein